MRVQRLAIREKGYFSILQGLEMGWRGGGAVVVLGNGSKTHGEKNIFVHPSSQALGLQRRMKNLKPQVKIF